jgi:hypothetical protein
MSKQLLAHIYSSLQSLEKCAGENKTAMLTEQEKSPVRVHDVLEQDKVLRHMRRAANRLQLDLARKDWSNAHRSLEIFYGLHSMVRPEIVSTYSAIRKMPNPFHAIDSKAVFH